MKIEDEIAYQEGEAMCRLGCHIEENPFPRNTPAWRSWNAGWREINNHFKDDISYQQESDFHSEDLEDM